MEGRRDLRSSCCPSALRAHSARAPESSGELRVSCVLWTVSWAGEMESTQFFGSEGLGLLLLAWPGLEALALSRIFHPFPPYTHTLTHDSADLMATVNVPERQAGPD